MDQLTKEVGKELEENKNNRSTENWRLTRWTSDEEESKMKYATVEYSSLPAVQGFSFSDPSFYFKVYFLAYMRWVPAVCETLHCVLR